MVHAIQRTKLYVGHKNYPLPPLYTMKYARKSRTTAEP